MADYYLFTYFLKLFFDDSFPSRYFYENQKRKLAKFLCDDTYGPMIYIRHIYFMDLAMYGCKIRYINMVRIEFYINAEVSISFGRFATLLKDLFQDITSIERKQIPRKHQK